MTRFVRAAVTSLLALALTGAAAPLAGTFALQDGTPKTRGYLRASVPGNDPLAQHLDIWTTLARGGAPLRSYAVEMTKRLHLIVVSDDLTSLFIHAHPVLGADGHFTLDVRFPRPALYHVYADCEPAGAGQQVFRFDLPVAGGKPVGTRRLAATGNRVVAGPYTVELSGTTSAAGKDAPLSVHITSHGKPATNLHPYLGALAHAVFVNAADLSYVHVHPMPLTAPSAHGGMSGMSGMGAPLPPSAVSAPDMLLHLHLREAGTYKLWLQFRGGRMLYVAPFVLTVSGSGEPDT